LAVLTGHTEIVKMLVEAGADLNHMTNDGRTPLDMVYNSHRGRDMRQFLISRGAKTGSEMPRNTNADSLDLGARMANIDISSSSLQDAPQHAVGPAYSELSEELITSPYPISQFIRPDSTPTVFSFEQSPHPRGMSHPRAPMFESLRNVELNIWATPQMFTPKW
jgi:ankyrin repeat protein